MLDATIIRAHVCSSGYKKDSHEQVVYNLVIYNGKEVYTAPRNLWSLFTDVVIAKKVMTEDYQLVDLQSMSDDEIMKKKHVGMLEYMLKVRPEKSIKVITLIRDKD